MIHLVQIGDQSARRVAVVEEPHLRCLETVESVYALAQATLRNHRSISEYARALATGELLDYDTIYNAGSRWRLLPPIDVPGAPWRTLVAGTGLTHLGSAKDRQAMHLAGSNKAEINRAGNNRAENPEAAEVITDSMRMFQWGVEKGRPAQDEIGVAPEWFYKGNGSVLQAPFAPLTVPAHAEDGGEEAEVAGVYIIGEDGVPRRIGMAVGNEFSDHKFEKRNYLNLAGSKLRACSLGPELVVGGEFQSVAGKVRIERAGTTLWEKSIETGEENMCHSLANLEHHHFKFEGHRLPGDVHVHFFGAHSLSFGDGVELQDGDWTEVRYEGYGRALRNPIRIEPRSANRLIRVDALT